MIFKKYALLFLLLINFSSCTNLENSYEMKPDVVYKNDMIIEFENMTFEGVAVLPERKAYKIDIEARGDLDVFSLATCHREEQFFKNWNIDEVKTRKLFGTKIKKIEKKKELSFIYTPTLFEKNKSLCPLLLTGLREEQGRHSWAYIDFMSDDFKLISNVSCNGVERVSVGVEICQAKSGLAQSFQFGEPVSVSSLCSFSLSQDKKELAIIAESKRCHFKIHGKDSKMKLTVIGYDEIAKR